jgi:ATP-dependent helicase HrpA
LIEKITALEEKVRRHDLLIGEEEMAQFYDQRLPGIFDIRSLQRLIRDKGDDAFLRMSEEDLLVKRPDPEEIALYPEAVSTGGWRLPVVYRFEPGEPLDGITLKIPVPAIPSLPAGALDWAVPGLLREKVMALLRGLPKEYRKKLQPLAQTCEVILREMAQEGPLPTALGRFVFRRYGVNIPANLWPVEELEEHLKLRYAVVDGRGRELAAGRDIGVLRQEFVGEQESRAFAKARLVWEKSGVTEWDFGELPERITLNAGGHGAPLAFPAVAASEEGIAIRLFPSEPEAKSAHREGVKALLALRFRDEMKHLRKGITPAGELKLWAAAFGGVKPLENAILEKVMDDLFAAEIRSREAFDAHADKVRPQILPRGQAVVRLAGAPLKALYEATALLHTLEGANRGNRPLLSFLAELRGELARHLPADFLIRHGEERLCHIVRYVRALTIRAERGAVHLEKALERGREIDEIARWYDEALRSLPPYASGEKRRAMEEFGWMIEEYKVSLFAQEIKTAFPVSRKRLAARMGEIERML